MEITHSASAVFHILMVILIIYYYCFESSILILKKEKAGPTGFEPATSWFEELVFFLSSRFRVKHAFIDR